MKTRSLLVLVLTLTLLNLPHPAWAGNPEAATSATNSVNAELGESWELQFYRLTEPSRSAGLELLVEGPLPKGLVPALGTIDRVETTPGKFLENTSLIFLHFRGNLTEVPKGEKQGLSLSINDPDGNFDLGYDLPAKGSGEAEATVALLAFPPPLGIYRVGAQTLASPHRTLFNASFTVGKYLADISVGGLPNGTRSGIDLDGLRIGETETKTSIGLGWLPTHSVSLSMPDVSLNGAGSRYHASQSELKVSVPGDYDFEYRLQHYLTVQSPHPTNGSGWYDHGETVPVSALAEVGNSKDSRDVFRGWSGDYSAKDPQISVIIDASKQVVAQYVTQYLLTVVSQVGIPQGSGWYDAGLSVSFSVTSPLSAEGLMGMLGGKYVFDHWSGDSTSNVAAGSVTMDGPKTVKAEWRTDNTIPYILLGGIGAAISVLLLLLLMKRRKAPASSAA